VSIITAFFSDVSIFLIIPLFLLEPDRAIEFLISGLA